MAKKVQVRLEDDLKGGEAAETVLFGLDGTTYEMDLSEDNAQSLRDALEVYVQHARVVPTTKRGKAVQRNTNAKEIRSWAISQGLEIPARGRLPKTIVDKYNAR